MPINTSKLSAALRTHPRARRVLRAVARPLLGKQAPPPAPKKAKPLVSVIVPIYNVEDYLAECLDSILAQTYKKIEVIVVDDGSPDGSYDVAARYAELDPRIRIVRQENAGLSEARNKGVSLAKGDFLSFIDSDDIIDPRMYQKTIASLKKTGSDFAVVGYSRFNSTRRWDAARWIRAAHAEKKTAVHIEDHPAALVNAMACSKVIRRTFWDAQGFGFMPGVLYEDQIFSAELYAKAETFDLLPDPMYRWRAREDGTSITQTVASVKDIGARISAAKESLRVLRENSGAAVLAARYRQIFANDLPQWLVQTPRGDERFFRALSSGIAELLEEAPDEVAAGTPGGVWADVAPQHRVLFQILLEGAFEDAVEFADRDGLSIRKHPTAVADGGISIDLPLRDRRDLGLTDDMFVMKEYQTTLVAEVLRARWAGEMLRVEGFAYIENVDNVTHPATTEMRLVERSSGRSIPIEAHPLDLKDLERLSNHEYARYEDAGFWFEVDPGELAALQDDDHPFSWQLETSIRTGGVERSSSSARAARTGSAGTIGTRVGGGGFTINPRILPSGEFVIRSHRPPVVALAVGAGDGSATLTMRADDGIRLANLRVVGEDSELRFPITDDGGTAGRYLCTIEAAKFEGLDGSFTVRATSASGSEHAVAWQAEAPLDPLFLTERVSLRLTTHGNLGLRSHPRAIYVSRAEAFTGEAITFRATSSGGDTVSLGIEGRLGELYSAPVPLPGDSAVTLDLTRGGRPMPSGTYRVAARDAAGNAVPVFYVNDFGPDLPATVEGTHSTTRLERSGDGLRVVVAPPYAAAEIGPRHQRLLQERYAASAPALEDALLFRTYFGETASCNALAVHEELRGRGSDLALYWTVKDHSVEVPEGGIAVVRNSARWYELLAGVRYYLDNMHQPEFVEKKPGQTFIQTFHGYPFKAMGTTHWNSMKLSKGKIASYIGRAADWDYLVSPATYATEYLKREFVYDGKVLEIGYPRNDELARDPDVGKQRSIRAALGIDPAAKVLLYAPTFRDYESANDFTSAMVDFLDVDALAEELGGDWVILLRGHAYHARQGVEREVSERVVNVTAYPHVNDLIAISDASVLDYSSIRFDYAVTGKPMIFMVPDLQRYVATRPPILEFGETAPGPLLNTTAEVAAAVLRLDDVRAEFAGAYAEFRRKYVDLDDGHASKRLVDAVFSENAPPA